MGSSSGFVTFSCVAWAIFSSFSVFIEDRVDSSAFFIFVGIVIRVIVGKAFSVGGYFLLLVYIVGLYFFFCCFLRLLGKLNEIKGRKAFYILRIISVGIMLFLLLF